MTPMGLVISVWWACSGVQVQPIEEAPAPVVVVEASQGLDVDLRRSQEFLATRPIYETPLGVGLRAPEGLSSLSAESCGACHPAIYAQWKVSTHAMAWQDPQYQAEIAKSGNRWLCLNCHTPLMVQQDRWPVGLQHDDVEFPVLVDNPAFDPALRNEGITCVACHLRDGVLHGPGLSDSSPPHAVVADPAFTDDSLCLRCHQAVAVYPGKTFVCTFDTGQEWSSGPYPDEGTGCVDCHMPRATAAAALDGPERVIGQHWWKGAGIPKQAGLSPPDEANPPGLALAATWSAHTLTLTASNQNAGHKLPTGDPERWVQLDVRFVDADGLEVQAWTERIGQTWEWWPEVRKLGDNRLDPREERVYSLPIPEGAVGATVQASSHRMTTETAEYHHLGDYPTFIVTHTLVLP